MIVGFQIAERTVSVRFRRVGVEPFRRWRGTELPTPGRTTVDPAEEAGRGSGVFAAVRRRASTCGDGIPICGSGKTSGCHPSHGVLTSRDLSHALM